MSDRIKGLTVVFEKDYREDDIERLLQAICLFRGVLLVQVIKTDPADFIERSRVRNELTEKLWKVLETK